MSKRLNIWDFDDTLAWSNRTIDEFKREYPYVKSWQWWHDPERSTEAILETLPVLEIWKILQKTPGIHWILTGRNLQAVKEWFSIWIQHPELGKTLKKISRISSTSEGPFQQKGTPEKKKLWIENHVQGFDEIHVYDDNKQNLDALETLGINTHYIKNGREVYQGTYYLWSKTGSDPKDLDKNLQIVQQSLKTLSSLETISESPTYSEIFRSTVDILKSFQRDILKKLDTEELLDLIVYQLNSLSIDLDGDLKAISDELNKNKEVEVSFRFNRKLKEFYKFSTEEILRAIYGLRIQIESLFNNLQLSYVCKLQTHIEGKDGIPIGFTGVIKKFYD